MNNGTREIWLKGNVKANALFSETSFSTATRQVNEIQLSQMEISQTVVLDKFEPKLEKKDAFLVYNDLKDVKIRFKGTSHDQIAFNEDIEDIVINEVEYVQKVSISGQTYHILEGIIYFKKTVIPIEVPKTIVEVTVPQKIASRINEYPIYERSPDIIKREDTFWDTFFARQKRWFGWDLLMLALFGFLTYKTMLFPFFLVLGSLYLLFSLKNLFSNWNTPTSNQAVLNTSNFGCFTSFYILLGFFLIGIALINGAKDLAITIGWIMVLLFVFQLLFSGNNFINKAFRLIGGLFLLFLSVLGLVYFMNGDNQQAGKKEKARKNEEEKIDFQDKNKILKTGDSLIHYRDWKTLSKESLNGKYFTQYPQFNDSEKNRNTLQANDLANVYFQLAQKDKSLLGSYIKVFDSIRQTKKLNTIQLADAIVSSIQSIPYVLVHEGSCRDAINNGNSSFLIQYHRDGKECMPNIKYGVQSGYEFLHNLKGDCDTRALLCFELLNHYKFPVALLISPSYGHCILGIDLPLNGLSLRTSEHNYLVWETTAKGFKPGELAPEISDMNNWSIAITN
jgi:hypothetical protein